jgi:HEPN domain-containing protein
MDLKDYEIWLWRANQDWLIIENSLSAAIQPWSLLSFHAQQVAEKSLKALISFENRRPPKIHDLTELLRLVEEFDKSLLGLAADCEFLTQFAVDARYGDFEDEFAAENGLEAIQAAKRIYAGVQNRINI